MDLDFEAAGAKCVDHVADLGHRSIGFLGAPRALYRRNTGFAHRTMAGFGAAAMRRGVMATAVSAEYDRDSVLSATKTLIRANPSMTALVVHNEAAPGWIIGCLRAAGRQVPGDVAVVAICPDDLAEQMSPPLTSVRLPADELGGHAVKLLVAKLDGEQPPPLMLLPPRLSRRASTPALDVPERGAVVLGQVLPYRSAR